MNDINLINVECQSRSNKSNTQLQMLALDHADLQKLLTPLKHLQQHSGKVLKQYHDYLSAKDRKNTGLPYHLIKKCQQLRKSFSDVEVVLEIQCRFFRNQVSNRDFQKSNQQNFFRKTLMAYDERRLWLKKYILRNEAQMQVVQQEVKKNVEYETHRFTQKLNTLDIQRLEHNFDYKINAKQRVHQQFDNNIQLKLKLRRKLEEKLKGKVNGETKEVDKDLNQPLQQIKKPKPQRCVQSFLSNLLTKQQARLSFLLVKLKVIKGKKTRLTSHNMQLKNAIDRSSQIQERKTLEQVINNQGIKGGKLTKTDYLIFIKELHEDTQQRLKVYGQYFQYSLMNYDHFPNSRKSKSLQKGCFPKPISQSASDYRKNTLKRLYGQPKPNTHQNILISYQKAQNQQQQKVAINNEAEQIVLECEDKQEKKFEQIS